MDEAAPARDPLPGGPALLPGSSHFLVIEEPAYAFSGSGEHLYVEIEKEGLTTDQVAEALARACGRSPRDIGYAGRKDRWGITRQWFSVHFGEEERLAGLAALLPRSGSATVVTVSRHGNKLRLGHLTGNRFRLAIAGLTDPAALLASASRLAQQGIVHRFGEQRFGHGGATLVMARAWGRGDMVGAVERIVDPHGHWHWGGELPPGFRHGPEGRVLGALRSGADPLQALRAAGEPLRKLAASAAQAAVFNTIAETRQRMGLLHRPRVGDIAATVRGALFTVTETDLAELTLRAAPGRLDAILTAPLPGTSRLRPAPDVDAQERAWAAPCDVDWSWFDRGAPLESPGERRPLLVSFRSPPTLTPAPDATWLEFALPPGSYATEVLRQLSITVPEDRRGA